MVAIWIACCWIILGVRIVLLVTADIDSRYIPRTWLVQIGMVILWPYLAYLWICEPVEPRD